MNPALDFITNVQLQISTKGKENILAFGEIEIVGALYAKVQVLQGKSGPFFSFQGRYKYTDREGQEQWKDVIGPTGPDPKEVRDYISTVVLKAYDELKSDSGSSKPSKKAAAAPQEAPEDEDVPASKPAAKSVPSKRPKRTPI